MDISCHNFTWNIDNQLLEKMKKAKQKKDKFESDFYETKDDDELQWYMAIYPKASDDDVEFQFCLKSLKKLPLNIKEISYYFEMDIPELNDRKYRGFGCFCYHNLSESIERMTSKEMNDLEQFTLNLKLRIMNISYEDTDDDMINID